MGEERGKSPQACRRVVVRLPQRLRLIEMPAAVMAEQAVDVGDAEEGIGDVGGLLVEDVLHGPAVDDAEGEGSLIWAVGLVEAVAALGGDQLGGHLVCRVLPAATEIVDPLIEGVAAFGAGAGPGRCWRCFL